MKCEKKEITPFSLLSCYPSLRQTGGKEEEEGQGNSGMENREWGDRNRGGRSLDDDPQRDIHVLTLDPVNRLP